MNDEAYKIVRSAKYKDFLLYQETYSVEKHYIMLEIYVI